jgi:carbonic anhydrase/acetyltransferase-like protein (isoleucine patch superfamily)
MLRSFRSIHPTVPKTAYVDISAQVLGDVTLGEHSSVWMNAVLRGDVHSIRIGDGTNVQDCAVLHGMKGLHPVIVGNGCTIGHNATVHGCVLEDDVLVGMGAIILNGAHIGAGSIIAAGALVPEGTIIPPRSLVAGIPGRIRRSLEDSDLDVIRQYAKNYLEYTKTYLGELA